MHTQAEYSTHNRAAVRTIDQLPDEDLSRYRITSPVTALVAMRLDQVVKLIAIHEQRHLQQAIRVLESEAFPKS
jgi:hypothetical protein